MAEETPTPGASEEGGTGQVTDPAASGGDGGSQVPAGYVPLAELEKAQATARGLQSERDKMVAERDRLARALVSPEGSGGGKSEGAPVSEPNFLQVLELRDARDSLKGQYPDADPSILAGYLKFGSAEALEVTVRQSHEANKARIDARVAEREEALRKEFGEKFSGGTPPAGGSTSLAGDPTLAQLADMTDAQWRDLESKSPGIVERVLRSAPQ